MLENGWELNQEKWATGDRLFGLNYLYELYLKANKNYTGRVTVPVLWDKKENTIVNNESAEIISQLNQQVNHLTGDQQDFYPEAFRDKIDGLNDQIYSAINNGVYRCGFATTQAAYEEAYIKLFVVLDTLDARLRDQRYLLGERLTETDWRLFTTLILFDAVYYSHFKTNQQRIRDYKGLYLYLKRLYYYPGIEEPVNFWHIKQHYYFSHKSINPTQIVPLGPNMDFSD